MAERTGVPELALPMEEGEQFMKAAQNVLRHYNVQSTQKTMDWISFAGISAMIYVPRFVAIGQRSKAQRQSATVHPLRPVQNAPSTPSPQQSPAPMSPMEAAYNANMVIPEAGE